MFSLLARNRDCATFACMNNIEHVISELTRIYDAAVSTLRADIMAYATHGTLPPPERVAGRAWTYPELRLHYSGRETHPDASRAFGRLPYVGTYSTR
jgi:AMP nucleosidase